jgi:hypothetical protein
MGALVASNLVEPSGLSMSHQPSFCPCLSCSFEGTGTVYLRLWQASVDAVWSCDELDALSGLMECFSADPVVSVAGCPWTLGLSCRGQL